MSTSPSDSGVREALIFQVPLTLSAIFRTDSRPENQEKNTDRRIARFFCVQACFSGKPCALQLLSHATKTCQPNRLSHISP